MPSLPSPISPLPLPSHPSFPLHPLPIPIYHPIHPTQQQTVQHTTPPLSPEMEWKNSTSCREQTWTSQRINVAVCVCWWFELMCSALQSVLLPFVDLVLVLVHDESGAKRSVSVTCATRTYEPSNTFPMPSRPPNTSHIGERNTRCSYRQCPSTISCSPSCCDQIQGLQADIASWSIGVDRFGW